MCNVGRSSPLYFGDDYIAGWLWPNALPGCPGSGSGNPTTSVLISSSRTKSSFFCGSFSNHLARGEVIVCAETLRRIMWEEPSGIVGLRPGDSWTGLAVSMTDSCLSLSRSAMWYIILLHTARVANPAGLVCRSCRYRNHLIHIRCPIRLDSDAVSVPRQGRDLFNFSDLPVRPDCWDTRFQLNFIFALFGSWCSAPLPSKALSLSARLLQAMTGPEEKTSHEHPGAPEFDSSLIQSSESSHDGSSELAPQLHAKTFLAVAAVCLIYFAQLVSLVGAGVVSQRLVSRPLAGPVYNQG